MSLDRSQSYLLPLLRSGLQCLSCISITVGVWGQGRGLPLLSDPWEAGLLPAPLQLQVHRAHHLPGLLLVAQRAAGNAAGAAGFVGLRARALVKRRGGQRAALWKKPWSRSLFRACLVGFSLLLLPILTFLSHFAPHGRNNLAGILRIPLPAPRNVSNSDSVSNFDSMGDFGFQCIQASW